MVVNKMSEHITIAVARMTMAMEHNKMAAAIDILIPRMPRRRCTVSCLKLLDQLCTPPRNQF